MGLWSNWILGDGGCERGIALGGAMVGIVFEAGKDRLVDAMYTQCADTRCAYIVPTLVLERDWRGMGSNPIEMSGYMSERMDVGG
jgi:hypothetical protein